MQRSTKHGFCCLRATLKRQASSPNLPQPSFWIGVTGACARPPNLQGFIPDRLKLHHQAGLKTGMYYLRTRAAADAIKFTVDQQAVAKNRAARAGSALNEGVAKKTPVLEAPIGFTPTPEVKVLSSGNQPSGRHRRADGHESCARAPAPVPASAAVCEAVSLYGVCLGVSTCRRVNRTPCCRPERSATRTG